MASILIKRDREVLCGRVASLTAVSAARWGCMSVGGMLAHLCQSARLALGELETKPRGSRPFQLFPLKHLFIYVLPFPKGVATSPELITSGEELLEKNQPLLLELLRRLGEGPDTGKGPVHPFFGLLSRREWGVLMHKHVDHHLRQFGA